MAEDVVDWRRQFEKKFNTSFVAAFAIFILFGVVLPLLIVHALYTEIEIATFEREHGTVHTIIMVVWVATALGMTVLLPLPQWIFSEANFFCPHCGKHIASSLRWVCGYCGTDHWGSNDPGGSFLLKCGRCKQPPRALICPHPTCSNQIFLDDTRDDKHPAMTPAAPIPGETQEATHEALRARRKRERELVEDTRLITEAETRLLEAEVGRIKQERQLQALKEQGGSRKPDPVERLRRHLEDAVSSMISNVKTQKQLRETIGVQRMQLEQSQDFQGLTELEQKRARENFDAIADHFEQLVRKPE